MSAFTRMCPYLLSLTAISQRWSRTLRISPRGMDFGGEPFDREQDDDV